jgi:polyisoprenoid-binding protein YceI
MKTAIQKVVLLGIWLFPFAVLGQPSVSFKIKNAGLTVEGKFTSFVFDIDYDPKNPSAGSFKGSVEVASIDTGIKMRDSHLKKDDYFDVALYPKMSFVSTQLSELSPGKLQVKGNLTIKKTTRPLVLEVEVSPDASGKTKFTTSFKINRLDFGVGSSSWTMANDLQIFLQTLR